MSYLQTTDELVVAQPLQPYHPTHAVIVCPISPVQTECSICYGASSPIHTIPPCNHQFCQTCIMSHISTMLDQGQILRLTCPQLDCPTQLTQLIVAQFVPDKLPLYRTLKLQQEVRNDPNLKFCPWPYCGRVVKREGPRPQIEEQNPDEMEEALTRSENKKNKLQVKVPLLNQVEDEENERVMCPHCHRMMCFECGGQYHSGLSCQEAQDPMLRDMIRRDPQNYKLCPHCRSVTARTQGCMHMTCPNCKKEWCWRCSHKYERKGIHICKKTKLMQMPLCKRICCYWCLWLFLIYIYLTVWFTTFVGVTIVLLLFHVCLFYRVWYYPCSRIPLNELLRQQNSWTPAQNFLACICYPVVFALVPLYIFYIVASTILTTIFWLFADLFKMMLCCKLTDRTLTLFSF